MSVVLVGVYAMQKLLKEELLPAAAAFEASLGSLLVPRQPVPRHASTTRPVRMERP